VERGVQYVVMPGTKDPAPPRDAQTIQQKGRLLFERAGLQPQ
jgi:hypothetical protein